MRKTFLALFAIALMALLACQPTPKKTEKKEPVSTRWTDAQAQQWAAENG